MMPSKEFPSFPLPHDALQALKAVLGPSGLLTGQDDLGPFREEARGIYSVNPAAVLRPETVEQVRVSLAVCSQHGIGVVPVGGNTGMVGGTACPAGCVIITLGRLNKIVSVDRENATLTLQAGCTLLKARTAARNAGLDLPLSFASEGSAQIGGVLATNAGGINVIRYGNARAFCLGLEVVLPDGRLLRELDGLRKNNTGYDLKQLFIGSEGTLGLITAATLQLHPMPIGQVTALVAAPGIGQLVDLLGQIKAVLVGDLSAFEYISAEAMAMLQDTFADARLPFASKADAYGLIEIHDMGQDANVRNRLEQQLELALEAGTITDATIAQSEAQRLKIWGLRERLPEAQRRCLFDIKHDISVPISSLATFVEEATVAVAQRIPGIRCAPFGHIGDGNLHFNFAPPADMTHAGFLVRTSEVNRIVHDLCSAHHGSISAEHGIGRSKCTELVRYRNETAMQLMRQIRSVLDPAGIMNPGAVLAADQGPSAMN